MIFAAKMRKSIHGWSSPLTPHTSWHIALGKISVLLLGTSLLWSCSSHRGAPESNVQLPDSEYEVLEKETYTPDDWEEPLSARVYRPVGAGPHPAVLVVHGGGWQRRDPEDMESIAESLAEQGFVAVNIEYRFAPDYRFPAQLHDVQQAMHWLHRNAERLHIDPEAIGALGYSSGSHLITLMALVAGQGGELDRPYGGLNTRPVAVVAGGLPSDLRKWDDGRLVEDFIGGTRAEQAEHYALASPIVHVHADAPPFFLFHGTWDRLVPTHHATDFYEALQREGITSELYLQRLRGHITSFLFRRGAINQGTEFLYRHLHD